MKGEGTRGWEGRILETLALGGWGSFAYALGLHGGGGGEEGGGVWWTRCAEGGGEGSLGDFVIPWRGVVGMTDELKLT